MLSRFDGRSDVGDLSLSSCANFDLRNVLSSSSFILVNSVSHHLASFARNPSSCVFRIQTLPTLEFETFRIHAPTNQYMAALSIIYECMPPAPISLGRTRLPSFHTHLLNSLLHGHLAISVLDKRNCPPPPPPTLLHIDARVHYLRPLSTSPALTSLFQ